nr:ubiquitin carboxyl-terminal hydrolase L3 [Cryptococcus depauperatus CBS 7841]
MPSKWVPLEASPDWSKPLGLPPSLTFQDLFSIDPEFLEMIPHPHRAVLLLFPSRGSLAKAREKEDEENEGWKGEGLWWIKQTIPNACGSIGLLHALLNLPEGDATSLTPGSELAQFKAMSLSMSGAERANLLEKATFFSDAHTAAAQTGQSNVPTDLDVDTHFIAFVEGANENGEKRIVELDGGRKGPLDRGASICFLQDVANMVQEKYFDRAEGDVSFNLIVLAGQPEN